MNDRKQAEGGASQVSSDRKTVLQNVDTLLSIMSKVATLLTVAATLLGFGILYNYTSRNHLPFDITAFPITYAITAALTGVFVILCGTLVVGYPFFSMTAFPRSPVEIAAVAPAERTIDRLWWYAMLDGPARILAFTYACASDLVQWWLIAALLPFLIAIAYFSYQREAQVRRPTLLIKSDPILAAGIKKLMPLPFAFLLGAFKQTGAS